MFGLKYIKNLISSIKKTKDDMISENELISYKQNFTGQEFQWIKTNRPELLGKVVKCRDVNPSGNRVIAIFDDGSTVDIRDINNNLLMLHGDMQPLSKEEVSSISAPPSSKRVPDPHRTPNEGHQPDVPLDISKPPKAQVVSNPFAMFNSDITEFIVRLNIKLPDKKLLKMMYENAEDKDEFIKQLANYIASMINNTVVSESLYKMFNLQKSKKPKSTASTGIKLHEVGDNEE